MADITVRQFRQILLWPLQLTPTQEGVQIQKHSERDVECWARSSAQLTQTHLASGRFQLCSWHNMS